MKVEIIVDNGAIFFRTLRGKHLAQFTAQGATEITLAKAVEILSSSSTVKE